MNEALDKILKRLENYSDLSKRERKSVQKDLIEFSLEHTDTFIEIVRGIKPEEESVLFEVYESLSNQPDKWVDLMLSEFDRIEGLTKQTKSKLKDSVSSPLIAISFFARQEFANNDKLIGRIKKGVSSDSKQIAKISLDLLSDVYMIDKSKYSSCRQVIERQTQSKTSEISQLAEEILHDFDNPIVPKKKPKFYSAYTFVVFMSSLVMSIFSTFLYDKIFIDFSVLIKTFFGAALLMWLIHSFLTRDKLVKQSETLAMSLGFGFIGCFLLLFLNFKVTDSNQYKVEYAIIEHGTNINKTRPSEPFEQPYVKFERKGKLEELSFYSSERGLVEKADYIELTLQTGIFGYTNIVKKELKTTGANSGS